MVMQGYLKEALKDKMKYLRNPGKHKKMARQLPRLDDQPKTKKSKKDYTQYPKFSHEPLVPPEEDESSNLRNQKMILDEEKRSNPNKRMVSVLMDRTFAFRRQDILKTSMPIMEVLKLYPSLKELDHVSFCYHW